jgi:hypothetical protein
MVNLRAKDCQLPHGRLLAHEAECSAFRSQLEEGQ